MVILCLVGCVVTISGKNRYCTWEYLFITETQNSFKEILIILEFPMGMQITFAFPWGCYFSLIQEVLFHELIFGRVICWEGGFVGLKIFRVPWKPHPFLLPNKKGSEETQPNGTWIYHVICWWSTSLPASTPYRAGYLLPCLSAWVCPRSTLCLPGSLRQCTHFTT